MRTDMIIPILFVLFLIVYFFIINPAQEEKKKAAKEAAKIASIFDSYDPTLYIFQGKDSDGVEHAVFALCSRGYHGDRYESEHVYELANLRGSGRGKTISNKRIIKTLKKVDYTLSLLPYHVYHCTAFDTWEQFCERRQARLNRRR